MNDKLYLLPRREFSTGIDTTENLIKKYFDKKYFDKKYFDKKHSDKKTPNNKHSENTKDSV
tara:strand:+ start:763 stop:945 length:183 start_codon:yes stop_codon:yes gene_type:complete